MTCKWLCLLLALVSTSRALHVEWHKVESELRMKSISVGRSGVWTVAENNYIYYLQDTYADSENPPAHFFWTLVRGFLTKVDVGKDVVYGINKYRHIYIRSGINSSQTLGTAWTLMNGYLKDISVSPEGHVWGVNREGYIFIRVVSRNQHPQGDHWQKVAGKLKQISAGQAGVWGVGKDDRLYCRTGAHGDEGFGWTPVGGRLKQVSSEGDYVIGVNHSNEIFARINISATNPTGTGWYKLNGKLKYVDACGKVLWGVNTNNEVYYGFLG